MGLLDKIRKTKKNIANALVEEKTDLKVASKNSKKEDKKEFAKSNKKTIPNKAYKIIVSSLISEKAAVGETQGKYTFVVNRLATKLEIKKAVENVYGIRPIKVRTINFEGRNVRFGNRLGRRGDWKKAIVFLPKGKTLDIHIGV